MHQFQGKWITNEEFYNLKPRNVFHRQLDIIDFDCSEHRNKHILFRKKFNLLKTNGRAIIYISADDFYRLYINGKFITIGPAPAYHFNYNYNVIDVTKYLSNGENLIAVHTFYQGLINRVWQSGDNRHGLILDLCVENETVVKSDESFLTTFHTAYEEIGTVGYATAFLDKYDSNSLEIGFENIDFDDSNWENAKVSKYSDYKLNEQKSAQLTFEKIKPKNIRNDNGAVFIDFGAIYVGHLYAKVKGTKGQEVIIRQGQELLDDGSVRFKLRSNCNYEEKWVLSDGESSLDQFDYKSFRYASFVLPKNAVLLETYLIARHYPFELKAKISNEFKNSIELKKIWELCVNSQKYGVQDAVLDCMDREKGFYLGDGCYSALAHMVLTHDDVMVRKLIDEAFSTVFITDGLVTCINCSFMQEIAEFPLILVKLVLWHYNYTKDIDFLRENYSKVTALIDAYKRDYEDNYLLKNLDKWCVVEWPKNFRDGYDVDIQEGKVCEQPHVAINAYYLESISVANRIASILSLPEYRDITPLKNAFMNAFYNKDNHLFKDGVNTEHISFIGNIFAFAYNLCEDKEFITNALKMIDERKISSVCIFGAFPLLEGLIRNGYRDKIKEVMSDKGAWLRMIEEGATTTFEGWGKDTKWNTSLFHLTLSLGAVFLSDVDIENLLI